MNKIVKGSVLLTAIALTACSGSSSSNNANNQVADANGVCSQSTMKVVMELSDASEAYTYSTNSENLKKVAQRCLNLKSHMGSQTCKASKDSSAPVVSWDMFSDSCESIIKAAGMSTDGSSSTSDSNSKSSGTPSRSTTLTTSSKISLIVISEDFAKAYSPTSEVSEPTVLQKGRSTKNIGTLDRYSPYCVISGNSSAAYVGASFELQVIAADRILQVTTANGNFVMSCQSRDKYSWSLSDLKEIFGSLGYVTVK